MTLTILICIVLAIQVILLAMVFIGLLRFEKNAQLCKENEQLKRQIEKQKEQIRKLEQRQNKSRADNGDML